MQIYGKYEKEYTKACKMFVEERERFWQLLQDIPYLRVFPSEANYFLCEVTERYTSAELANILISKDIIISNCNKKKHMSDRQIIRLAIRNREDNDTLIHYLKELS